MLARSVNGFLREAGAAINVVSFRCGDGGNRGGALPEGTSVEGESFPGPVRNVIAEAGLPWCRFGRFGSSFNEPTAVTDAISSC